MERMRRAEWRRRADDPTTMLGWWWRSLIDDSDRTLAVVATGFPLSLLLTFFGLGWAWIVGVLAAIPFVAGNLLRLERPNQLASLLPAPPPPGQFKAAVTYRRQGIATGRDEMALTVVDGWLVGEGVRSDFALRAEDVAFVRAGAGGRLWLSLGDGTDLVLCGVHREETLERWWAAKAPVEGEPTFPPARAHPQELARRTAWLFGMAAVCIVVFGWVGYVVPKGVGRFGLMVASCGIVGAVMARVSNLYGRLVEIDQAEKAFEAPVSPTQPSLSPRPPLQDEPLGEGESVRA